MSIFCKNPFSRFKLNFDMICLINIFIIHFLNLNENTKIFCVTYLEYIHLCILFFYSFSILYFQIQNFKILIFFVKFFPVLGMGLDTSDILIYYTFEAYFLSLIYYSFTNDFFALILTQLY
jgi:hypothetical protein